MVQVRTKRSSWLVLGLVAVLLLIGSVGAAQAAPTAAPRGLKPKLSTPVAHDVSASVRDLAQRRSRVAAPIALPEERGPVVVDKGFFGDGALQSWGGFSSDAALQAVGGNQSIQAIPATMANFEGLSNQDNFNLFGGRVNPPDPVGDVGPNHYVEMINLAFAVYNKLGTRLLGPLPLGDLWAGFPVTDCADNSGDPIVIHDQFADRWILTQFTAAGPEYFNCVAISQTADPTGVYYRYAFSTGENFPDYPKYGLWRDSYLVTTREFGPTEDIYGIGVYALERDKMLVGDPNARMVGFLLEDSEVPINLIGDGLLPPDLDGQARPLLSDPAPIIGTQDDEGPYGATFDALNIWEFEVKWRADPIALIGLETQLPVAEFDSIFPCAPTSRDCLPQPGITDPNQFLDILSYRQRPTWRLAWRKFSGYESMVTNQSVEAMPGVAGVRWYEIRRTNGTYTVHQQGTYAPGDGIHRWMGSIAQDRRGNMAVGYSVVNATTVFPGIRYTGRLAGDPLGQMPQGEGMMINGSGVQTSTNSRWGDYTSMNIDPADDCTFWYVNEYYTAAGQASSPAGWQTRIASFKFPGC